jgi:hypothetical protein
MTSGGQPIETAVSPEARNVFGNNNLFRQAKFQPKKGLDFTQVVEAAEAFKDTFGQSVAELEQGAVAREIRQQVERCEESVQAAHSMLAINSLPGADVLAEALNQMLAIRKSAEDQVIQTFNSSHQSLKEAIRRAAELEQSLGSPQLEDIRRARVALTDYWPFLAGESDITEEEKEGATQLEDILQRENFFRDLAELEQRTAALEKAFAARRTAAIQKRSEEYEQALSALRGTPGWEQLDDEQQEQVASALRARAEADGSDRVPIPLVREQIQACPQLLAKAREEMLRLIDGNRVEPLDVATYFAGGIETEEQLEAALDGLRERVHELIAAGKKVLIQ